MNAPNLPLPIPTGRLIIRRLSASDAKARFALHSDPEYVRFIGRPIDRERSDAELERELAGKESLFSAAITREDQDEMIGECVLVPSTVAEVELVIAFLPGHRGTGYGQDAAKSIIKAALKKPEISTVIACVEDDNVAARRLVEQLGMLRDGIMPRQDGKKPHRYVCTKSGAGD